MNYYENDLWSMKEISHSPTMCGSASHLREVIFKKEATVKDFVENIIYLNDGHDHGEVYVNGKELLSFNRWNGSAQKTELNQEKYNEIKDSKIIKGTSDNEWYTYSFNIVIKEQL